MDKVSLKAKNAKTAMTTTMSAVIPARAAREAT
jgi:hypothetical protein